MLHRPRSRGVSGLGNALGHSGDRKPQSPEIDVAGCEVGGPPPPSFPPGSLAEDGDVEARRGGTATASGWWG